MPIFDQLIRRNCPVCDRDSRQAAPFLEKNINSNDVNEFTFSSRKAPEFMCLNLVKCRNCKTVYASETPVEAALSTAYADADYDSSAEATLAAASYMAALRPHLPAGGDRRRRALEIGTGTGVFLERLLDEGFAEVVGVEPSGAAIRAASPRAAPHIRPGIFNAGDFETGGFDLICCFQTLEHVPDPKRLTRDCKDLLAPGGVLAFVTHNYDAAVNRLLGKRSPIIDVEHLQLFCPESMSVMLTSCGLDVKSIGTISNRYFIEYWLKISPLGDSVKTMASDLLRRTGLSSATLSINVGNFLSVAENRQIDAPGP